MVRGHEETLGLKASSDFARFIERDFAFYSRWYERLRNAAEELTLGLESVHFNAQHNFILEYPVLLASLRFDDPEAVLLHRGTPLKSFPEDIGILLAGTALQRSPP